MRLYAFPSSPHCLKVRAVANELGVELMVVEVNILRGESHSPLFERLNPNGLVPVLVDGDFVLWESSAILTYLATLHRRPVLLPLHPRERADVDRWLHWQSAHLGPAVSRVAFERFVKPLACQAPVDETRTAEAAKDLLRHCRTLELSLADKAYVAGRLSVADFAIACLLSTAAGAGLRADEFPRTRAFLARMFARRSMRQAYAEARRSLCRRYRAGVGPSVV
jgi:glutathione S-transferase